ncbi:MAG: Fic family protein [Bacteroidetes bacterium]|nr:Fic family protein [Bacteroidota bacterium]
MDAIQSAIAKKEILDGLRPIDPEREQIIMQKFRLDWNYHSNHIEGNSLSYGETKALVLFGITGSAKPLKDYLEVEGHNAAIDWVLDVIKDKHELTENFIRELHTLLLKPTLKEAITPDGKATTRRIEVGQYKKQPNHVITKTGETFRFATPEETPAKMHDLIAWYREERKAGTLNPILLAAEFHYKFVRIHPFDDGNGRMSRILMNFILMQYGYPPVIIKTENKEEYYMALQQADAGIITPFIEYIAANLNSSLDIMIAGSNGESIEEPDDIDKELQLLEHELNGTTKKIEVYRAPNVIRDVLKNEFSKILRLSNIYMKNLFAHYRNIHINLIIDQNEGKIYGYNNWLNEAQPNIISSSGEAVLKLLLNSQSVTIRILFLGFISPPNRSIKIDRYTSEFTIYFHATGFQIVNSDSDKIFKFYTETPSDSELEMIVKKTALSHLRFIKDKIQESQSQ